AEKVFETTYATGVKVVVNYNALPVDVEGYGEIEAMGYVISPAGEVTEEVVEAEVEEGGEINE
ncbi:MAG: hypothetical protein IJ297_08030, partial [Clostridia bacterium]|nr:hypothetical protein [Clostridia bacterium]